MNDMDSVVVDCDRCVVRSAAACQDCFVSVLLGAPGDGQTIDAEENAAIAALADSGLVPPLRLVVPLPAPVVRHGPGDSPAPRRGVV